MKEIVKKNKCCGCYGCMNICPKNAIEMREDAKGFKYPSIDQHKCIDCGLCKKICPILNNKETKNDIEAYACYNINNDERINSSSGGIFVLLAKEIIKRKGVIFGAKFDKNYNTIHSSTTKENELIDFMGSKYMQSIIGNTYKEIKELLDKDIYVLFTGTPCQVEGLKSYLKKEYKKLYTQDIICHGVPSPKVWRKYIEFQKIQNGNIIKKIQFRNKDKGWTDFNSKIEFDNSLYCKSHKDDLFMKTFLNNLCLRESCYNCSFKKKNRVSDITLADYWGINKFHPDMNDDKGTSLVIVNSTKGKELFELIKNNIKCKQTNLDYAIKYNPAMIKSVNKSPKEDLFYKDIDNLSFDKLVKKYVPRKSILKKILLKIKKIIKK